MGKRLTDQIIAKLPRPATGNKIYYDAPNSRGNGWTPGFGCRVTAAGAKAFVFVLSHEGRAPTAALLSAVIRRGAWSPHEPKPPSSSGEQTNQGDDPLGVIRAGREAPTMADLCDRFREEHLPKKRPYTRRDYERMITLKIIPALGSIKVSAVTFSDVEGLHRKIGRRSPYEANRCVAVLSKMFRVGHPLAISD